MSKDLLRKYSPQHVLVHLARVFMLKIGEEWKILEIQKKSRVPIDGFKVPIMQDSGS